MSAPDRARLAELLDSKCVCTEEAELEICPRCLGLMSWVEVALPGLLDALDEAEKALREVIECADCGGSGITSMVVNPADLATDSDWEPIYEPRECGCRVVACEALARIGAGE